MYTLDERYPDLLCEHGAPERRQVIAAMDALATTYEPTSEVRASMQQALSDQAASGNARHASWLRTRPRRSIVLLVAAVVAAALAGTAAATGIIPLADQALAPYPDAYETGIGQIVKQDLGEHLNISRSIHGFTMNINRAYADTREVVVAYTLSGPSGRSWNPFFFYAFTKATDARGDVFPFAGGQGTGSAALATSTVANGNYTAFDISHLRSLPDTLALRLTVPAIQGVERVGKASPKAHPGETYFTTGSGSSSSPYGSGPTRSVRAHGAVTFVISIPIDRRARVIPVHQAITAAGVTLTLDRAGVTPIGAWFSLEGAGAGDFDGKLSIGVAGHRTTSHWQCYSDASRVTISCDAPLYDYHGPVTLTLRALHWVSGKPTLPGGPWTFHFTMP